MRAAETTPRFFMLIAAPELPIPTGNSRSVDLTAATLVEPDRVGSTARTNLTLAALGVVYGDIGTSPLYTMRQSLLAYGETTEHAILGVVSLIFWSLVWIVTVKYVIVIMRADNRGEGGLLVLTALVLRTTERNPRRHLWIMAA